MSLCNYLMHDYLMHHPAAGGLPCSIAERIRVTSLAGVAFENGANAHDYTESLKSLPVLFAITC